MIQWSYCWDTGSTRGAVHKKQNLSTVFSRENANAIQSTPYESELPMTSCPTSTIFSRRVVQNKQSIRHFFHTGVTGCACCLGSSLCTWVPGRRIRCCFCGEICWPVVQNKKTRTLYISLWYLQRWLYMCFSDCSTVLLVQLHKLLDKSKVNVGQTKIIIIRIDKSFIQPAFEFFMMYSCFRTVHRLWCLCSVVNQRRERTYAER